MLSIWKYLLSITNQDQDIDIPVGAKIIHIAAQSDILCLWALVDPSASMQQRWFRVHNAGHNVDPKLAYVGSAMFHGGKLVFHVFEVPT